MSSKNLILIIIILIIVGFGSYQLGLIQQEPEETEEVITFPKTKLIQSWSSTARGEVIEISGRTITLEADGDVLVISLKENAGINRLIVDLETNKTKFQAVEFQELKVGAGVHVLIQLKDGKLLGESMAIITD